MKEFPPRIELEPLGSKPNVLTTRPRKRALYHLSTDGGDSNTIDARIELATSGLEVQRSVQLS